MPAGSADARRGFAQTTERFRVSSRPGRSLRRVYERLPILRRSSLRKLRNRRRPHCLIQIVLADAESLQADKWSGRWGRLNGAQYLRTRFPVDVSRHRCARVRAKSSAVTEFGSLLVRDGIKADDRFAFQARRIATVYRFVLQLDQKTGSVHPVNIRLSVLRQEVDAPCLYRSMVIRGLQSAIAAARSRRWHHRAVRQRG